MKKLLSLALFLCVTSAQASYYHVKCSNASGTVKWETGHNSNSMTLSFYGESGPQELNLSMNKVKVEKGEMVTIVDKRQSDCAVSSIASSTTVTAGKVVITPSEEFPNSMELLREAKIEAEVICERHINGQMYCPNN